MKVFLQKKSDVLGMMASTLCLLHCLATPFLFIAQSCTVKSCCESSPTWWSFLDFVFIILSFIAIFYSLKTSSNTVVKFALVITWSILFLLIVNERIGWLELSKNLTYIFAILLSVLHLYNLKYYQCEKQCCTDLDINHSN